MRIQEFAEGFAVLLEEGDGIVIQPLGLLQQRAVLPRDDGDEPENFNVGKPKPYHRALAELFIEDIGRNHADAVAGFQHFVNDPGFVAAQGDVGRKAQYLAVVGYGSAVKAGLVDQKLFIL